MHAIIAYDILTLQSSFNSHFQELPFESCGGFLTCKGFNWSHKFCIAGLVNK